MSGQIKATSEWVLGPQDTPFYTKTWSPEGGEAKAHVIFVHGFAEHINRYNSFFTLLASPPYNLRVFAFDQRGSGRTSFRPDHTPIATGKTLDADVREGEKELLGKVEEWRKEGKTVSFEPKKSTWRVSGGWAGVMPDMEWFVLRQSEVAKAAGKKLFLYAHSMGGAQTLGFITRQIPAAPSASTVAALAGVIVSGPLIRQTKPAPSLQVAVGGLVAKLAPNKIIPAPIKASELSHDEASNTRTANDALCKDEGTLRGIADMLNYGASLDNKKVWDSWPKDVPLCLYVADEDLLCDPKAGQRFAEGVPGATFRIFKGAYHEIHLELPPFPEELAKFVGDWVDNHASGGAAATSTATAAEAAPAQPESKL